MDAQNVPKLDDKRLTSLGLTLGKKFEEYERDRRHLEEKWLKNLRQFKGQYDPEVLSKMPANGSRAYPKITRTKVIGTLARLMEMLFPQTDKNWGIDPSPMPDLSVEATQQVLDDVQALKAQIASQNPEQPASTDLSDDEIEKAIYKFAKKRCAKMGVRMDDQLAEMQYVTMVRRVVFSAILYNVGYLRGPMVKTVKTRSWKKDPLTQRYTAYEREVNVPYYEVAPVWSIYPDLSAKTWESQDGFFERHIMSREQVFALMKRPDFLKDRIRDYLTANRQGNYKERHWEIDLRTRSDKSNVADLSGRKYELLSRWGYVSGHDLKAAGVEVAEAQLGDEFEAETWTVENVVVKAILNPYDGKSRPLHPFIYQEDDQNLLGESLPDVLRDSQLSIAEAARMTLDNASAVCGPNLEINEAMLIPGQSRDIHSYKIWWRYSDEVDAGVPAVRSIPIDSHISELIAVMNLFNGFADTEAALPPPAVGDVSKGGSEALRTTQGASLILGAAALPIRDTVRNFDRFTTSVMTSLYDWNMQFVDDDGIKGDYMIVARGSTSLIAKEVRASALDYFAQTLTDEEKLYLKTKEFIKERLKVRDLPMDLIEDDDVIDQKLAQRDQSVEAQQTLQDQLIQAQVKEILSQVTKNLSQSQKNEGQTQIAGYAAVLKGIEQVGKIESEPAEKSTDNAA